ncbi:MAG: methyltransferase [Phycisphaerae bacterium]
MERDAPIILGRDTQEYILQAATGPLSILGPGDPTALLDDPAVLQRNRRDDYMPYWATPWPAAVMLADYLLGMAVPPPAPILELGAGLGIVGLALARAGLPVVVTDYDENALAYILANAKRNAVELQDVTRLDWRQPPTRHYPTLAAADVLYETRNHQPLARFIAATLETGGRAYICDPNRMAAQGFDDALGEQGLDFQTTPVTLKAEQALAKVHPRQLEGTVYKVFRSQ